jgi:hypothetical protein
MPRRRYSRALAAQMAADLRRNGPRSVDELLERCGYPLELWQMLGHIRQATVRMAIRDLLTRHGARLNPDGTLYLARYAHRDKL